MQLKTDYGRVEPTQSYIIISAEELVSNNDEVILQLCGTNLDKKDWFGKSDPFIEIYKSTESGDFVLTHKTEVSNWKFCVSCVLYSFYNIQYLYFR